MPRKFNRPQNIVALTSRRKDGNARSLSCLNTLLDRRGLPLSIATAKQVHGMHIVKVPKLDKARKYPAADGLMTPFADQPLGIFTADCASIFLSAPSQGVVGLLHAGWRGVRGKILQKAIRMARREWNCQPADFLVWIGPSIGPCCFEVRWDAARFFPATRHRKKDRWVVDIHQELERQARRLGVQLVKAPRSCTHHQSLYHSFRRDQTEERQVSIIMRRTHGIAKKA